MGILLLITEGLMQELEVDVGVASEAAALLDEGKGVFLTPPSFGSKSVRNVLFCAEILNSCAISC